MSSLLKEQFTPKGKLSNFLLTLKQDLVLKREK